MVTTWRKGIRLATGLALTVGIMWTGASSLLRNIGYVQLIRATVDAREPARPTGRAFFESALRLRPLEPRSTLGRALSAVVEQDARTLEDHWTSKSETDRDRVVVRGFLERSAGTAAAAGRFRMATWAYAELRHLDARNAAGYAGLGEVALAGGLFSQALEFYRQLEICVPEAKNASLLGQGQVLRAEGQYHAAVAAFEQVLNRRPSAEEKLTAYYQLGVTYEAANDLDSAALAFTAVVHGDPLGDISWLAGTSACRRGMIALRRNQPESALADYELGARLHRRLYPQYARTETEFAGRIRQSLRSGRH